MHKIGLIIINGYFENEAMINQRESLKAELVKLGVKVDIMRSNKILAHIEKGEIKVNISAYDFIVFFDKDTILAKMLEKAGYALINSAEAISLCDDKMLTYVSLAGHNIPMAKTISSPLMYAECFDEDFLKDVEKTLNYPIIIKKAYGSMGRDVFKAENFDELKEIYKKLKMFPHLYQEKVGKFGEDIRVIVIDNEVVAAMKRVNKNDFRSNIELGGIGEKVTLSEIQKNLAVSAAKILGLSYAGVDILYDDKNSYICEVNSNAFFKGITAVSGVNIAEKFAQIIFKKIYE